jgi:maleylacetate reductase
MALQFTDSFLPQQIRFGPGVVDEFGRLLEEHSVRKVMICTSASLRDNGAVGRLLKVIAPAQAIVFDRVMPHVPEESVEDAFRQARAEEVDGVVALGGGSAVGTAKAVSARLMDVGVQERLTLVAIPTTYAGSEMTPVYGVTAEGRKITQTDIRVLPRVVLYDPGLTLDLPASITASTAANALAHCVEGVYSRGTTPVARAAALSAIPMIFTALPAVLRDGHDRDARSTLLVAAHLGGVTIAHAGMALHHAICHALGPEGVPHGDANAIMLPHVMRFNLPEAPNGLAEIAAAIAGDGSSNRESAQTDTGSLDSPQRAVAAVESLFSSLPVPHRLGETVVTPAQFPRIAEATIQSSAVLLNPRPVSKPADVLTILDRAY